MPDIQTVYLNDDSWHLNENSCQPIGCASRTAKPLQLASEDGSATGAAESRELVDLLFGDVPLDALFPLPDA